MADSPFENVPENPFEDLEIGDGIEVDVSSERIGELDVSGATAAFVDEHGNRFPVEAAPITVSVAMQDGVAHVTSIVVEGPVADALEKEAVEEAAVEMIDEHMGKLAKWLAEHMPGEIDRMSPSETMIDMVIRKLGEQVPTVEHFVKDTGAEWKKKQARQRRYGGR